MYPEPQTATLILRLFGWFRVPLLALTSPSVLELDDEHSVIKIPLNYRTRNHYGAMYFGALNIGAEAGVGLLAYRAIQSSGKRIDFIFKDFKANYLKRAEGDVHFICEEGLKIAELVQAAASSPERQNGTFRCYAIVPSKNPNEKVAEFEITLSLKRRSNSTNKSMSI